MTHFETLAIARLFSQYETIKKQQSVIDSFNEASCKQSIPIDHDFAIVFTAVLNCLEEMGSITMTDGTREAVTKMKYDCNAPFQFLNSELESSGGRVNEFSPMDAGIAVACFINCNQDN